ARIEVQRARATLERRLAERHLSRLGADEWLVVDGVLSDSPTLSAHPRAVGVVKSHGAEYFEGPELERALTLPAVHRTSVFRPKSRGARRAIHSWYLRLWPWEGNDLLYGLLRVEARDAAPIPLLDCERDEHRDRSDRQGRGSRTRGAGSRSGRVRRGDRRVRVLRPGDSAARRGGRRGRPGQGRRQSDRAAGDPLV